MVVFFQEAPGNFPSPPLVIGGLPILPRSAAIGDLDGDGDEDPVSDNAIDNLTVFFQEPDGDFGSAPLALGDPDATNDPRSVAIGDLDGDGDGDGDFVCANDFGSGLAVFFQRAPGTFASPLTLGNAGFCPPFLCPVSLVVADIDGDGDLDLGHASGNDLTVFWGGR